VSKTVLHTPSEFKILCRAYFKLVGWEWDSLFMDSNTLW
jgi:hypothetical protein